MSSLTLRAQAFGPLQKVEWTIPEGVSAIVGPNRVGKSTLLALPQFLRLAIFEGLNDAVREVFDGPAYLRNLNAPLDLASQVGLSWDKLQWELTLSFAGGAVASHCAEKLWDKKGLVLQRELGASTGKTETGVIPLGPNVIPRICVERIAISYADLEQQPDASTEQIQEAFRKEADRLTEPLGSRAAITGLFLANKAQHFHSYRTYEYQLSHLLRYGSRQSSDTALLKTGENVFPLLRNWRDSSDTEPRFNFVLDTLREAFPHVKRVDFEQAGQSVTMAIRDARWPDRKLPISRESTGVITALLQLCAVASCPKAGLVTLDELETSLHPRAIQVLTEAFRQRAREQDLRIVLATQSETVLDQFHDCPEQIQVLEPNQETSPRRLTDMFGADWLKQFSLGDLFAHLEFGSNRESPAGP